MRSDSPGQCPLAGFEDASSWAYGGLASWVYKSAMVCGPLFCFSHQLQSTNMLRFVLLAVVVVLVTAEPGFNGGYVWGTWKGENERSIYNMHVILPLTFLCLVPLDLSGNSTAQRSSNKRQCLYFSVALFQEQRGPCEHPQCPASVPCERHCW